MPQLLLLPEQQSTYQFGYSPNTAQQQQQQSLLALYNTLPPALYQQIWHLPPHLQQQYITEYHKQLSSTAVGNQKPAAFMPLAQPAPVGQWGWRFDQQQQQQQYSSDNTTGLRQPLQSTATSLPANGGDEPAADGETLLPATAQTQLDWTIVECSSGGDSETADYTDNSARPFAWWILYRIPGVEMVLCIQLAAADSNNMPMGLVMRRMRMVANRLTNKMTK
jgi:hypothetical protein